MATPASWIATRPDIDLVAASDALARWWGIRGDLSELPSERDRNVFVTSRTGDVRLVLKVANLAEDPAFLGCQGAAMDRLAAAGVPVARTIAALDGRSIVGLGPAGPPWARVLTWLPGRAMAGVDDPTDELLADLGTTMGRVATAFLGFDHPAAQRDLQWDVRRAPAVIRRGLDAVDDDSRRATLGRVLDALETRLVPALPGLRSSVIHNDANDHNVLVDDGAAHVVGLLDFGDMVGSVTAHEAAVATTYAMFHRDDPLTVIGPLIAAFDRACPLTAQELDALPDLILGRLGASVSIAAHQASLDPDPYLRISEAPAWTVLERLESMGVEPLGRAVHEAVGR
jgi:Ser/Thr protein kinase RdoA (MazF antagonist)